MANTPKTPLRPPTQTRRRVQFVCDLYVSEVHAGIVDYARKAGWSLYDGKCYLPGVTFTYDEPSDGILTVVVTDQMAKWLGKQTCPIIRLLSTDRALPYPAVEPDSHMVGQRAAEHMLTLGSPTVVFYRLRERAETQAMWKGFSEGLAVGGKTAQLLDYHAGNRDTWAPNAPRQERWNWLRDQLATLHRPVAVLVEDDRFAGDLFEAAAMLHWRIPEDLAVLGIDNRPLVFGKLPVPLSSVDTNLYRVGWAGAELLDQILDGKPAPAEPILIEPGHAVARRSTATFVCDHPGVSAAVNFLRARFRDPVQLPTIAKAAGLSVRSLQSAFKEKVGRTISDELSRLRLECAARYLRETELKLESVARESGLGTAKYLCEVFREAFGETPNGYREWARAGLVTNGSSK